ncbi:magnesium chelatase ATPase subunit I [Methylobacterium sp. 37f]|uniref:magnesium chelatase ATPase subunit I n=1 Tax=Methylobacterium sp. 37f TaxID=2817058 RepID=UPI002494D3C3|nr:magnesium chelatase ATPase subunit I [Methylobacterium sp. 37f]MCK2054173.1 magnesium chelatase ATPase subunit I [Methylobacterium sp. 37f]
MIVNGSTHARAGEKVPATSAIVKPLQAETGRRPRTTPRESTPPEARPDTAAPTFPFSAIVGQDEMRRALLIAAVDPSVGGVLVFGDRGTGKSTAIRGLAALLPPMAAVAGCPYACDPGRPAELCHRCREQAVLRAESVPVPVVDLPLGATEDRVVGALDLERALTRGEKAFEPGLLARANRGFLYIDEVNLLEDHLVDLLLDVAASGVNTVEREGLSIRHPARFVLVGSGNPEEGELRPQLLDRFGLAVEVTTPTDLAVRIDVVRRRDAYERDPAAFCAHYAKTDRAIRKSLTAARARLPGLHVPDATLEAAARLCLALGTDGLRGELTLMRTARALAAYEGADTVSLDHLARIAPSALRHRLRRNPLDESGSTARVTRAVAEILSR